MLKKLVTAVVWLSALVGVAAVALGAIVLKGGISARPAPGTVETAVARRLRSLAVPRADRQRVNPLPQTPEGLRGALEHFADHCAVCHANDGSGDTPIGKGLYPRAPDMRLPATQTLSDGELFYIIEHGVRLTGMPAWGSEHSQGQRESWHLVQFIRHLPNLSPEELESMRQLNPKSGDEWRAEEETRRFLAGEGSEPVATPQPPHTH